VNLLDLKTKLTVQHCVHGCCCLSKACGQEFSIRSHSVPAAALNYIIFSDNEGSTAWKFSTLDQRGSEQPASD
jgi:hypothetical protein